MKRLSITGLVCLFLAYAALASAAPFQPERLTAESGILIEARTGKVIFAKDAERRLFPASTTKMMTLLVALENGDLDDVVTIGGSAAGTEGSSMELAEGDQLRLEELLYGMMLVSGNDAAIAVAEHLAGSVENYARRMTDKAREIGAADTRFVNSSGLPDAAHYATAHDLARIAAYGYKNSEFRRIVSTKERDALWSAPRKSRALENTNLLLGNYQGANGVKTGYTKAAGECLVASAERNGIHLVAVLMHVDDDRRWDEAATLLDYGFTQVEPALAYARDDLVVNVSVRGGKNHRVTVRPERDILYPISGGDQSKFSIKTNAPPSVTAPIQAGQKIGTIQILYAGDVVDEVAMTADQSVEEGFSLTAMIAAWYDSLYQVLREFLLFQ